MKKLKVKVISYIHTEVIAEGPIASGRTTILNKVRKLLEDDGFVIDSKEQRHEHHLIARKPL